MSKERPCSKCNEPWVSFPCRCNPRYDEIMDIYKRHEEKIKAIRAREDQDEIIRTEILISERNGFAIRESYHTMYPNVRLMDRGSSILFEGSRRALHALTDPLKKNNANGKIIGYYDVPNDLIIKNK
jgi:hypothetical protein